MPKANFVCQNVSCGKTFEGWVRPNKNKYCSTKCQYECSPLKQKGNKHPSHGLKRSNAENMIGEVSGKLTVIGVGDKIRKHYHIICKCECGNVIQMQQPAFRRYTACQKCFVNSGQFKYKGRYNDISLSKWQGIIHNAKNRKLTFNITIEYAWDIWLSQNGRCKLSNIPIFLSANHKTKSTASLDRIDSSKGYIEGNIQWLHKDINTMKWDFAEEQFINYCKAIVDNNKDRLITTKPIALENTVSA